MQRLRRAAPLAIAGLAIGFVPIEPLAPLDARAEAWFEGSALAAAAAYATVRILNGSVSVLKESDLQLEPAGVGVSLAVGQLLDPLDDMAERVSDVIVVAIVALGAQRILHEMGAEAAGAVLAVLLLLAAAAELLPPERWSAIRRALRLFMVLVVAARLAAPLGAVVGAWVHERHLAPGIATAEAELSDGLVELEALVSVDMPETEGFLGAVSGASRFVKARIAAFRLAFDHLRDRVDDLVAALLRLSALYVTAIVMQGVLLPLAAFGVVLVAGRALLRAAVNPPSAG